MFCGKEKKTDKKGAPIPKIEQLLPDMMDISATDSVKIKCSAIEIVSMLEVHHPDMIRVLTDCSMTLNEAKLYLTRVIEMSLSHHMMHKI
ncbi:hypothetical protein OXPF_03300 [Oxobacter pfennigii]|uniref:Uncharacterized protein n=1 Tax=Oxobacter pfennigii TaxID=36849 RepID=A0A0P8WB43_9CLOT|nr:hypothetical protein [Oxobacter pfennigii]KPU45862.1 hypothetical protein OXPF_03300 [Oxobacter pfennigii]